VKTRKIFKQKLLNEKYEEKKTQTYKNQSKINKNM